MMAEENMEGNEMLQQEQAFNRILGNVVELSRIQRAQLINQGFRVVSDLSVVDEDSLIEIFPTTGDLALTAMAKMRLKAFRIWTINKVQELNNTGIIDPNDFTREVCEKIQRKLALKRKEGKSTDTTKSIFSGTLDNFSGREKDWQTANRKLLSYLGQKRGASGIPLIYVVRNDQDRPDIMDEIQEEIWNAPLTGTYFESDNYDVYVILQQWTADGYADTHVDLYKSTLDGRAAYQALVTNYEGDDAKRLAIQRARRIIATSHFQRRSTNFTFDDYCNRHITANNELERRKVPLDGPSQVQAFMNGITREEYRPIKTAVCADPAAEVDLRKAIISFKKQIQILFPSDSENNNNNTGRGGRSIGFAGRGGRNGRGFIRGGRGTFNGQRSGRGGRNTFARGRGGYSGRGFGGRGGNSRPPDDGLYIPKRVLDGLNPTMRTMMLKGRDEMRKRNSDNTNESHSIKAVKTNQSDDDEEDKKQSSNNKGNESASSQFGHRNLGNRNRNQGALQSSVRRTISKTHQSKSYTVDYNERYRLEMDTRADTMCCGKGFIPIGEIDEECDVYGFHPTMPAIKNVPVRTCATAYDHENGETVLLVFGQALWFGDELEHSLACPAQIRAYNHHVCLTPKHYSNGESLHGIYSEIDNITLHFHLYGCISYLPIRTPTQDELNNCRQIILTCEEKWDPYSDNFAIAEEAALSRHFKSNPHERYFASASSKDHRSSIPPDVLSRRWGTSLEIATKTLKNTTQKGIRQLDSNLTRRFRTRQTHLRYRSLRTNVYSDTLFSEVKSARGFQCAQLFVTNQDFAQIYPMRSKADAPYKLDEFCKTFGTPQVLITDNAGEETKGEWNKVVKQYLLTQRTTEPNSGWQNRAEIEIRELKKHFRRIMHRNRCPEAFWCYGLEYTCEIRKLMARYSLDWRTPVELLTGDTPDSSEFLEFDFYGWVKFKDPKSGLSDDLQLGRWLGVAKSVGQAMTYWILKSNGYVVARSTVRPLNQEELHSEVEKEERIKFAKELKENVDDFDPELINTDENVSTEIMIDPLTNLNVDEDEEDLENDTVTGPDEMINAEIYLPHGDRQEIAKIIGRKRNADGNFIGRKHQNPILDSRIFVVEFPDGDQQDIAYNIIAEHLYSQVDSEGNQYRLFKEIINHRKASNAVDKSDQYRIKNGKSEKKKTTAGWQLECQWKDGTTSWIPLKELKETNPVEVALYAVDNKIDDEPAFDWWVRHILKKQTRLIKKTKRKFIRLGYKFGIRVPTTVEEALRIDEETGTKFWFEAIKKEMSNVRIAFDIQESNATIPVGYKKIPCHMIFDIKMDGTRKARLVAGGHVTDPPTSITYSSVVSRESVRIAFIIAALNNLDILQADIGNAYLNAPTTEKVYTITGPEFGDDAGRIAKIVRALYGLKSSGAAWHTHFAQSLTDLGFKPTRADPDVWLRPQTRQDNSKYYEYFLVYVDDCLVISENPQSILDSLHSDYNYRLKDVHPPTRFLGAQIDKIGIDGQDYWYISAELYLSKVLPTIEERFGKLERLFATSRLETPAPTKFHPEVDTTDFLDEDSTALYQSYIGILRWAVELGRIDLAHFASTMAKFAATPREGHLTAVIRGFGYIKKHLSSKLIIDTEPRDWSHIEWTSKDWSKFYPDCTQEIIPYDMPEPRGKPMQINLFCDASHATDLITRRSTTGIVILINGTPVSWYSKRQNTIESSTFGSEFVALKIATEMNEALRYKLRMFGIEIEGPTNAFCDNKSVVTNVINPESTLAKKHNAIAYHKVRESVAMTAIRIKYEEGKENCSDLLTKFLPKEAHFKCCSHLLYYRYQCNPHS